MSREKQALLNDKNEENKTNEDKLVAFDPKFEDKTLKLYLFCYYGNWFLFGITYAVPNGLYSIIESQTKSSVQTMGILLSLYEIFVGIGSLINSFIIDKFINTHYYIFGNTLITVILLCFFKSISNISFMFLCLSLFGFSRLIK